MRWEELGNVLSHLTIYNLARVYPSVESFLVNRSKALPATVAHGKYKGGGGGTADAPAPFPPVLDAATLAAVEVALLGGRLAPQWHSGAALVRELRHRVQLLPTGVAAVDTLLGGGLREGTLVEVAGATASGKTQLCLRAAATTACRGESVLYVDTTGSFAPERVVQLAEAEAEATVGLGAWPEQHQQQAPYPGLASCVLGCISVLRPANVYGMLGALDRLAAALQQQQQQPVEQRMQPPPGAEGAGGTGNALAAGGSRPGPRLRLLVVDSVSALLSTVLGNNQHVQGTALLTAVGHTLKQLAEQHSIAVLVTNHVTSAGPMARGGGRGGGGGGGDGGAVSAAAAGVGGLKPALGEQWRPQPHMRVQLSVDESQPRESGVRVATLTASPLQACRQGMEFRITASGLV